jgi:hypothetical protein
MTSRAKPVRQSLSLPGGVAKRIRNLARDQKTSANRVLVDLIETGLAQKEAERRRFFELAEQLAASEDASERQRLKLRLAALTFGE